MKKMIASVLTSLFLITSSVPAFAQESTQATAPSPVSIVNSDSISLQSSFSANVYWRDVPGATYYDYFVYKNGNLIEYGRQGVFVVGGQNRNVFMETYNAYKVEVRAVDANGNQLAWGTTNTFLAGPTSIYIPLY